MPAFAIPVAAPLIGPGAGAALGGLLVGSGVLIRELMLRDNLSPQFFDFRRGQDLENIGGSTIRLSDTEILLRLLEDAIKTPVNFPSPPNLPKILGPWLQDVYDFWVHTPISDWGQLNGRTALKGGPGEGTWTIGAADVIEYTFSYDLEISYPYGNNVCEDGPDGIPKNEKYPNQQTQRFENVQRFQVTQNDVTLTRICGATNSPSGQESLARRMVITQDGFDYVTENFAESGVETVSPQRSPNTQIQRSRVISIKKDNVEMVVPLPRIPVPGTDAGANGTEATAAPVPSLMSSRVGVPSALSGGIPVVAPMPAVVPTAVPVITVPGVAAPPVPDTATAPGFVPAIPVVPTASTDHVLDTPTGPVLLPGGTASPKLTQIAQELGRVEQKAAKILKGQPNPGPDFNWTLVWAALEALSALFEQPLPSVTYSITGVCEETAEGQPSTSVILPEEKWAQRLVSLGDMLPTLLQAQKDYKQPICGPINEKPPLEGQWVTTRWESVEKMDHSGRRLRKLFRYRTKSSRDLGQLSEYWADFVWRAGDVCVRHTGAWWGDPQVWAESEEEGKRVIQHAAAEARLDPDKTGRWAVSRSRSPRYGMSGTMKVAIFEGFPWVASRDGASWPNILAKSSDP